MIEKIKNYPEYICVIDGDYIDVWPDRASYELRDAAYDKWYAAPNADSKKALRKAERKVLVSDDVNDMMPVLLALGTKPTQIFFGRIIY
jgi:hypothetical protein